MPNENGALKGLDTANAVKVNVGEQTFHPAGANILVTEINPETGVMLVAIQTKGKPWESSVVDPKTNRVIQVVKGGEKVDKLPSKVYASTLGAVKLNAARLSLAVNLFIPADYGKAAKTERETVALNSFFGKK